MIIRSGQHIKNISFGGAPKGLVHNLLMQFFTLGSSKIKVFETHYFDILATHNDHPTYVKHVFRPYSWFFFHLAGLVLEIDPLQGGLAKGNGA